MKENILPLSLAQILCNVVDNEFRPTRSNLSEMAFDQRRDFILTPQSAKLAIRMTFANERCLNGRIGNGIRRRVSVILTDASNQNLHTVISVSVNLKYGECYGNAHACLPIDFSKVDFAHPYTIMVRDQKSGQVLGEREIRFFRRLHCGTYTAEILTPVHAGIEPNFSAALYKSYDADLMAYHYVRFHLVPKASASLPAFLPEMEVMAYFPDGTVESKFIAPVRDEDDAYPEIYRVSAPIFMTQSKKGVGYAELICLGAPIAGIVFNTYGDTAYGPWYAPDMDPLDEYSLRAAAERLENAIDGCREEEPKALDDDDFERALEEFISSQQEPEGPNGENDGEEEEILADDTPAPVDEEAVSPFKALDNLIGLRSVKEKLGAYERLVLFNKKRQERALPILKLPLHAMFWGSPGTGKTTVAKRMGLMLRRAGVLSKGHVVVRERATLLGPCYSNEETKTREAIEEAQGGILFIDEAYQLYQPDDPKDPGKFVIETLMTALADESKRDWMLILAGYTDEMKRMFEMNPGLKSRIPESNIYIFDEFSESELMEIAERYLERNSYSMTQGAKQALASRLGDDCHHRDRNFGNARHVINLIQSEILPSMASRVMATDKFDDESLSLIQPSDIPQPRNLYPWTRPRVGYRLPPYK